MFVKNKFNPFPQSKVVHFQVVQILELARAGSIPLYSTAPHVSSLGYHVLHGYGGFVVARRYVATVATMDL